MLSVGTAIKISTVCSLRLWGSTCQKLQGSVTGHCVLENLHASKVDTKHLIFQWHVPGLWLVAWRNQHSQSNLCTLFHIVFTFLYSVSYALTIILFVLVSVPFPKFHSLNRHFFHKVFSLRDLSAPISTQVILSKIWILAAINCRHESQIIIIKITKLPRQLTIFVSLPAGYSKKGKKKGTWASAIFVDHMNITLS